MAVVRRKVPIQVSIALRFEYQRNGKSTRELAREYGFLQTAVYRHATRPIPTVNEPPPVDRRRFNRGRPRILTQRDERDIKRAITALRVSEGLSFSAQQVCAESGVQCSRKSVSKYLHRHGYRKRSLRKKGQLTLKDRQLRVKYAKETRIHGIDYWRGIAMYLDGVSFVHKVNAFLKARNHGNVGYRTRSEGLKVTAKGEKEGKNGKSATFFVGVSHGQGVVFCSQFLGRCNGEKFSQWVTERFPAVFTRVNKGKQVLQDGCPVQNSAVVQHAFNNMGVQVVSIPARSPDLNPVENVFHNIRQELRKQALHGRIVKETYAQFCMRVRRTILDYSAEIIDKTIDTMPKRLDEIIASRGFRTKY